MSLNQAKIQANNYMKNKTVFHDSDPIAERLRTNITELRDNSIYLSIR